MIEVSQLFLRISGEGVLLDRKFTLLLFPCEVKLNFFLLRACADASAELNLNSFLKGTLLQCLAWPFSAVWVYAATQRNESEPAQSSGRFFVWKRKQNQLPKRRVFSLMS
jgi:hypothetical protein